MTEARDICDCERVRANLSPAELWRYRALDPDFVPRSREAREAMRAELQALREDK